MAYKSAIRQSPDATDRTIMLPFIRCYPMTIQLETERLILRPPTLNDAEALVRAINHPDIAATTLNIPHPYTIDNAKEWLLSHKDPERSKTGIELSFFIRKTGELIGGIGLMNISRKHSKAELGYWCAVEHWGKGYTTEAAGRAVRYCFEELGLHRVYAICMVSNPASVRVMEKIGMLHEGIGRKEYQKDGEYSDYHHYAILKEDWKDI